jgi:hypothetical protein
MTTKKHGHDPDDVEQDGREKRGAHDEPNAASKAAPREAPPQPFPFTASINEPQTVSLPVPENVEVPVPVIESLNPASCMIGDPDFTLVVSGDNFFADSVINFAGHDEPTTFDTTAKTLSTGVKPSLWAEPVIVDVIIKNGPAVSGPVAFEFAPIARASTRRK